METPNKPQNGKVSVIYIAKYPPFNVGDRSALSEDEARRRVEAGLCRYRDPMEDAISIEAQISMAQLELKNARNEFDKAQKAVVAAQSKLESLEVKLADAKARIAESAGDASIETTGANGDVPEFYDDWPVDKLKSELKARGIAFSARAAKSDLIELLAENDNAADGGLESTNVEGEQQTSETGLV